MINFVFSVRFIITSSCQGKCASEREFAKPSGVLTEGNVYALENSRVYVKYVAVFLLYRNKLHHVGNSTVYNASLLLVGTRFQVQNKLESTNKTIPLAGKHTDTDAAISKQHKPP